MKEPKIIISGGGTGGHIFPAIAIANAIKEQLPTAKILFVGAEGKMEMERVPKAGYEIVGLPIRGFQRKQPLTFLNTFNRLFKSLRLAKKLLRKEQPAVAVGVGGYASAAVLYKAGKMNIPTLIQEQNSYPGLTNKLLAKRVKKICVAYDRMERYFPEEKLIFTGNPIRQDLLNVNIYKQAAYEYYNLGVNKKTILVVGGSLGARTLNDSIKQNLELLGKQDFQVIWQTGKYYYDTLNEELTGKLPENVKMFQFLDRMDWAYAVADMVVSRAGALTISELSALGKVAILVPSPNVAEDHQTKNAMALVEKNAAVLVTDAEAREKLVTEMLGLIRNEAKCEELAKEILHFARKNAAKEIADEVIKLIQ